MPLGPLLNPDEIAENIRGFCRTVSPGMPVPQITWMVTQLRRFVFVVVWNGFDDMPITERQVRIWRHLRQNPGNNNLSVISMIVTKGTTEQVVEDAIRQSGEDENLPWS